MNEEKAATHTHVFNSGNILWCGFCGKYEFQEEIDRLKAALQAKDAEIAELKERLDKITLRMGYAMLATSTHRKPEEAGK